MASASNADSAKRMYVVVIESTDSDSSSESMKLSPSGRRARIELKEVEDRLILLRQKEKVAMLWTHQQLATYKDRAIAEREWKDRHMDFLRLAKTSEVEDFVEKARFHEVVQAKSHEAYIAFAAIGEIVSVFLVISNIADLQARAAVMEELTLNLERAKADIEVVLTKSSGIRLPIKGSIDDASTSISVDSHLVDAKVYSRRPKQLKK